jgi:hypothetical protein
MQRQSMSRPLGSEKEQLVQAGCISLRGTLGHDCRHALEHGKIVAKVLPMPVGAWPSGSDRLLPWAVR